MNRAIRTIIGGALLGIATTGCMKVSMPVLSISPVSRVDLASNKPALIQQEILNPKFIALVGKANGFSDGTIASFKVIQDPTSGYVDLEFRGMSRKAFTVLYDQLQTYVQGRDQGHTREFMLFVLTNTTSIATRSDLDLRLLLQKEPTLPASWLRKSESGTHTNKAGQEAWRTTTFTTENATTKTHEIVHIPKVDEVCRWTSYVILDGEIAWR